MEEVWGLLPSAAHIDASVNQPCGECAQYGPRYGYPAVTPPARALPPDGQDAVGHTRRQVARRVDGIARRAAQRHADGHDEHRHGQASEASHPDFRGVLKLTVRTLRE